MSPPKLGPDILMHGGWTIPGLIACKILIIIVEARANKASSSPHVKRFRSVDPEEPSYNSPACGMAEWFTNDTGALSLKS